MTMSPQFLVFNFEVQKSLKTQGFFINLVPKVANLTYIYSTWNEYLYILHRNINVLKYGLSS